MNYVEFQTLFFDNFLKVVFLGLFIFVFYIPAMKRKRFNIFSPVFNVFYSCIASFSVFTFLMINDLVDNQYVLPFFLSEFAFLIGFSVKLKSNKKNISTTFSSVDYLYFLFCCFVYFISTLIIYVVKGIPLFMDSRFSASLNGGGFGLFTRITSFSGPLVLYFSLVFLLKKNVKKQYKLAAKINLFFYCITLLLSGSKAAFYSVFLYLYIVCNTYNDEQPELETLLKKKVTKYFPLMIISIFLMFIFIYGKMFIRSLAFRLIAQGDAIFLTYVKNNIERLHKYNLFEYLFNNFFVTFRLFPADKLVNPAGMEIIEIVYGHFNDGGAVTPHNIDGYLLFGKFSFVFSFFVGIILNYAINGIYKKYRSVLKLSIFLSIYLSLNCISYNFIVALGNVTSVLLCAPIFIIAYYFILYLTPNSVFANRNK